MLSQTIAPILDDNTQTELTVWRQLGARGIQHAAHLVVHVHKRHVWALAISAAPFDQLPNTFTKSASYVIRAAVASWLRVLKAVVIALELSFLKSRPSRFSCVCGTDLAI